MFLNDTTQKRQGIEKQKQNEQMRMHGPRNTALERLAA